MSRSPIAKSSARTVQEFTVPKLNRHKFLKENLLLAIPFALVFYTGVSLMAAYLKEDFTLMFTGLFLMLLAAAGAIANSNKIANIHENSYGSVGYTPERFTSDLWWKTESVEPEISAYVKSLLDKHDVFEQNRIGVSSNVVRKMFYNAAYFSDAIPTSKLSFYIEDTELRLEVKVVYTKGKVTVTSYLS